MALTILPGNTIRFTLRPVDADAGYVAVEPSATSLPTIRKNGVTLTSGAGNDFTVTTGPWNNGHFVTITLATAAVAGDHFAIEMSYMIGADTYQWHEIGTCEHAAGSGGGGGTVYVHTMRANIISSPMSASIAE